jgi:transcriptional regulator
MYTPKFNQVSDRALLLEVMRAHPFAIVTGPAMEAGPATGSDPAAAANPEHGLTATHLPLIVKDEGEHGLIEGHFARANRHWQALAGREALVIFHGPHSYVSPSLYTESLSVPTWNYIAVHAYGTLDLIEDEAGKEALLASLIAAHDPAYIDTWHNQPEGYRRTMLGNIMGFRIPIARIEGKFKLSQNRAPEERRNVQNAHAAGDDDQRALAAWMARLLG